MRNQDYPFYRAKLFYNLKEFMLYFAEAYAPKIAFAYEDDARLYAKTYFQLGEDIKWLGTELMKLTGTKKRIAVVGENSYEWILAYLATVCTRKYYSTN